MGRRLRLTSIVPLVASVVAAILTILLLASGNSPSNANNQFWLELNMSGLGGSLVEIQPASTSSSDPLSSIIDDIPGLSSILDNITSSIGDGLSDLQGSLVGGLVGSLGVKDAYVLYVTKLCQGDFKDSSDPSSGINIDSCTSYRDQGSGLLNISNSIPSSFTVGTAQVSVPLVASLKQSIASIVNLAIGAATAMEVLLIIGCVASGLTAITSAFGVLFSRSRLVVITNVVLSMIASDVLLMLAILATAVIAYGSSTLSGFGSGFSIHIKEGSSFLAVMWVAAIMSLIAGSYWFLLWFVEFRESAFSRRSRTQSQIGNWAGILGEVRRDIKVDGHFPGLPKAQEHQVPSKET